MEVDEYRKMAAVEDDMWYYRALHDHARRGLVRSLAGRPAHILDAGCGTGGLIRRLSAAEPAWRWTGVDVSALACGFARERCRAEIVEASLTALPFPDGHFDAVTCADVLYHIKDDQAALNELCRVVKPGGVVLINVPAYPWLWSYHDEAVQGERRYSRAELKGKISASGLELRRLTYWNTLLFPLIVIRRKCLPRPKAGSDVAASPAALEWFYRRLMMLERFWLKCGLSLPWGSSLLAESVKKLSIFEPFRRA